MSPFCQQTTIAMTGCTLRVEAEKSVHALLGSVSIADCSLYASGHSGNSAKTVSQTAGLDAFETVSQQSGVTLLAASGFADVKTEAVCQQDVLFCTAAGLMTGTGNQAFSPDKPMTRAMLVTILWRMAGSPAAPGKWRLYRPESKLVPAGRRLGRAERHCCRNRRGTFSHGYSCHKGAVCRTAGSIRPDAWHFHPG